MSYLKSIQNYKTKRFLSPVLGRPGKFVTQRILLAHGAIRQRSGEPMGIPTRHDFGRGDSIDRLRLILLRNQLGLLVRHIWHNRWHWFLLHLRTIGDYGRVLLRKMACAGHWNCPVWFGRGNLRVRSTKCDAYRKVWMERRVAGSSRHHSTVCTVRMHFPTHSTDSGYRH